MKNNTNQMTKDYLVGALLKILMEKPLSSITITELCTKAGVSRMGFYRNYHKIDDVLYMYMDEIFENYKKEYDSIPDDVMYYDPIRTNHYFNYLIKYKEFFMGIKRCGFNVVFLDKLDEYMTAKWGQKDTPMRLIAFCGILYNYYCFLSNKNFDCQTDEMTKCIQNLFSYK